MSLTHTRLQVAVRVMRYYNSVPLTGTMPVMAPYRGCANHQFTSGYDFYFYFSESYRLKRNSEILFMRLDSFIVSVDWFSRPFQDF